MILNVPSFTFGTLYIDGNLKLDPSQSEINITATNIWVRGGKLSVGELSEKHTKNVNIKLTGGI